MTKNYRTNFTLLPIIAAISFLLVGCNNSAGPVTANSSAITPATIAVVDGVALTTADIAPLIANGIDKANAVDRTINRAVAANLAKKQYSADVQLALRSATLEIAAGVYANNKMAELLKAVTPSEIEKRYAVSVKDADYTGYQLSFSIYESESAAIAGRAAAIQAKPDALKLYQAVVADKDGRAQFIGRSDIPYNLGVLVAKLADGGFTEPAPIRNGYIVLHLQHSKQNQKPALLAVTDTLRRLIADERLVEKLAEARKLANISLK